MSQQDVWDAEDAEMRRAFAEKDAEIERLNQWVNDLQSGMYVNCVYCGHRYGPLDAPTPVSMADTLKAHIEQCPEHPLSHAKAEIKLKDEVLASVAREGIGQRKLIAELADALKCFASMLHPPHLDLLQRAREVKP